MSMSNPRGSWWRIGVAGGIPLLALALGMGEGKQAPRSKPGEQRRGAPGALIGIAFA